MSTGSEPHLQMSPKHFTMATNRQCTMVTTNAFINSLQSYWVNTKHNTAAHV